MAAAKRKNSTKKRRKNIKKLDSNTCLYCGSYNTTGTKVRGKGIKGTLGKGLTIGADWTSQEQIPELKITCKLCEKKYHFIGFTDPDYLESHIQFSDVSLLNLKHQFPKITDPFSIMKDNLGIARLEKKLQTIRPTEFHICFKKGKDRGYLNCRKKGNYFRVISVERI